MKPAGTTLGLAVLFAACGGGPADDQPPVAAGQDSPPGFEPPIVVNAETPVRYPADLYAQKAEGTVVLRLFIDDRGDLIPDSTRIAEGSGYPQLDSAALRAVPDLVFAPARRDGTPVATSFLQPVHFRHPDGDREGGLE